VARIGYVSEDNMIWRRNLQPTITVCGSIVEGVTGNDVTKEVYNELQSVRDNLPGDLAIEIGGSLEDSKKTLRYLLKPVPIMILLMTILLMLELQDVRKLFIIICTVPLGIIGVVWGLLFFNSSMGMMAQIGTLALGGIIIRNSVVLIDQIKQHLEAGMSPIEAITESAIVRFRPIMLAAFTTVLGLIPLFFSDFWNSMAVTIAAGLTGATLLTLVVLPVLYAIIFKIKN
jgi:multidrug efflux pump